MTRPYNHRGHKPRRHQRENRPKINLDNYKIKIQNWIKNQIDEETIDFANEFGKQVAAGGLTTSQIRIVFGEMRRIQMNGYRNQKTDFLLLKAKLAYAVKRHNKFGLTDLYAFFEEAYGAVDKVNDDNGEKHFKNLMDLMEAILAYHKYHGGREN